MPKRKVGEPEHDIHPAKRQLVDANGLKCSRTYFREGLFQEDGVKKQAEGYSQSEPYKHGVIADLLDAELLRAVRTEIQDNLSFTPKETDIYKIHQSGDLANLDGLDNDALGLLPSLKKLRDALYSLDFRKYLCDVTGSALVSGRKTDMAINVYTPGCHLLCHDDVIGSRRISYILYLTDPDKPWEQEWGGALRLYPTQQIKYETGEKHLVPMPDHSKSIPPAFNQLSFFAVQPGQSFHDVEEVYASEHDGLENRTARVRMAISGWYHVPQVGEEGYNATENAASVNQSSLAQLEGSSNDYDMPRSEISPYLPQITPGQHDAPEIELLDLTEKDFDFLLKYIAPQYLTPDTLDEIAELFEDECSVILDKWLSPQFCDQLRTSLESMDLSKAPYEDGWEVATPPHKHRFLYYRDQRARKREEDRSMTRSPLQELVEVLLPSTPFRKWVFAVTGNILRSHDVMARRFRRGQDYTLAQTYDKDNPRLEMCLSLTPTAGWDDEATGAEEPGSEERDAPNGAQAASDGDLGGYLAYMAGDDDDLNDNASNDGVEVPTDMSTGGRATRVKKPKADPAIYQAQDEEDDGVLFSMPSGWNKIGIVLRDKGTMRFVKYVSRSAKGDRWDVFGEFETEAPDEEDDTDVPGGSDDAV